MGSRREKYRRIKNTAAAAAGVGPFIEEEMPAGSGGGVSFPRHKGYDRETGEHVFTPGHFQAPLGVEDVSVAVRAHEIGHLITMQKQLLPRYIEPLYGAAAQEKVNGIWLQGIMDVYVNAMMDEKGSPDIKNLPLGELDEEAPTYAFVQAWIRASRIDGWRADHQGLYEKLSEREQDFIKEQVSEIENLAYRGRKMGEDDIVRVAGMFQDLFGSPDEQKSSDAYESVEEHGEAVKQQAAENDMFLEQIEEYDQDDNLWGRAKVTQLNLSRRLPAALRALRPKAGFVGPFRYPLRSDPVVSDGRCFAERRKVPGGTVLVDCSGSMSLSEEQIRDIIEAAPAATIACYASDPNSDTTGTIWVVAKRGKFAPQRKWRPLMGYENVIDGPALMWLANQEGPRIWVSDGLVTGNHAARSTNLLTEAAKIVRRGKIKRLLTPEDAVAYVRGRNVTVISHKDPKLTGSRYR